MFLVILLLKVAGQSAEHRLRLHPVAVDYRIKAAEIGRISEIHKQSAVGIIAAVGESAQIVVVVV